MSAPDHDAIPLLRRGFRLQWEPAQQAHVLLYPEGMVKLNDSAAQILRLVNGERSVADIVATLHQRFPEVPDLEADVLDFLEAAHGNHWLTER